MAKQNEADHVCPYHENMEGSVNGLGIQMDARLKTKHFIVIMVAAVGIMSGVIGGFWKVQNDQGQDLHENVLMLTDAVRDSQTEVVDRISDVRDRIGSIELAAGQNTIRLESMQNQIDQMRSQFQRLDDKIERFHRSGNIGGGDVYDK